MSNEIWKDIKNFEGFYQVSNLGRVQSVDRIIQTTQGPKKYKSVLLKISKDKDGYLMVHLYKTGEKRKTAKIHRLVMEAFTERKALEVNHINLDKEDNRLLNLEWVTRKENQHHAKINGRVAKGAEHKCAKLSEFEVYEIKTMLVSKKYTNRYIAEKFNVSFALITLIKQGKKWGHING